jgi:hypothetical protein
MAEYTKYKRGSEWRKWDLHIHTPETKLNSQGFEGENNWDKYCEILENSDVAVFGITDYFSADNYFKFLKHFNKNYPESKKVFFPNIEFRLDVSVNKAGEEINLHVLFSDKVSELEINEFLSRLNTSITLNNKIITCNKLTLTDDFQKATIKYSDLKPTLKAVFGDNKCYLIIAASNNQGLRADSRSPRKLNISDEIDKICDGFFGNSRNVDYFLNQNRYEESTGGEKDKARKCPVISCSDAHSFEDLENKLGKYYEKLDSKDKICDSSEITWIKADPTFEGIRQTLFEPEDRVKIQTLKPDSKNERNVISELKFNDPEFLFGKQVIYLNENLNSIIGGKSSGKSLLLFSTAKSIDPEQVVKTSNRLKFDGYSFNSNYGFEVVWKNGEIDTFSNGKSEFGHKISYIPQLYINYLVEKDNKEDLNLLIKNILLQDEDFRLIFDEAQTNIAEINKTIEENLTEYFKIRKDGLALTEKSKELGKSKAINDGILKLEAEILAGQKASNFSQEEILEYGRINGLKSTKENELRVLNSKETALNKVFEIISGASSNLFGSLDENGNQLLKGQVSRIFEQLDESQFGLNAIHEKLKSGFEAFINSYKVEIGKLGISESKVILEKELNSLNEELKPYLNKLSEQGELKKISELVSSEKVKLQQALGLEKDINELVKYHSEIRKSISELVANRIAQYKKLVDSVNASKSKITDEITLTCKLIYKKEKFQLFDQANKAAINKDHFFYSIFNSDYSINFDLLPSILNNHLKTEENKLIIDNVNSIPLRQGVTIESILRGLIVDEFELDYNVTYRGDNLLSMSPGKKGTVLLILFLQISSSEFPILIDQPEDNLDNRTIYELLCNIIKKKKKERQIIIVSHNANLVVATDSENIIVANQEGQELPLLPGQTRFQYINGSIEHSFEKIVGQNNELYSQGVREHVCDILEGGDTAFKQREMKYAIK